MTRPYVKAVPPPDSYKAWGDFPEGPMERHHLYGHMTPAKKVLIGHLTAEGWVMDARSAEWVSPDGSQRARLAWTIDGMTAWLSHPVTEEGQGAGPQGTNLLPPDTHRITLS